MKGFEDACQNFDIKSDCCWALLVYIFRGLTDIWARESSLLVVIRACGLG